MTHRFVLSCRFSSFGYGKKYTNFYKTIKLAAPGRHNILNALACICVCHAYGIEREDIKNALQKYTGAHRRFEFVGKLNGARIYDDYAHHPTEIKATINAAKELPHNKLWIIFQPHTYTRTSTLFNEFSNAFTEADELILTDIYAAWRKYG